MQEIKTEASFFVGKITRKHHPASHKQLMLFSMISGFLRIFRQKFKKN